MLYRPTRSGFTGFLMGTDVEDQISTRSILDWVDLRGGVSPEVFLRGAYPDRDRSLNTLQVLLNAGELEERDGLIVVVWKHDLYAELHAVADILERYVTDDSEPMLMRDIPGWLRDIASKPGSA